jgi:prefoldin subunit 5
VYKQLDNADSPVCATVLANYVKDPNKQPQKIKEFVTYTLTSTFIEILLKYGLDANFKVKNDNTIAISSFLSEDKRSTVNNNIIRATTLYELFFAAIPGIIDRNVEEHWGLIFKNFVPKDKLKSTKFPTGTRIKNFSLRLPLSTDDNIIESVTIEKYFEAVLSGKVSLKDIIGELQYTIMSEQEETETIESHMQLRDTESVDYKEPSYTEKTPKNQDKVTVSISEEIYIKLKNRVTKTMTLLQKKIRENDSNYVVMLENAEKIDRNTLALFQFIDDGFDKKKKAAQRRKS